MKISLNIPAVCQRPKGIRIPKLLKALHTYHMTNYEQPTRATMNIQTVQTQPMMSQRPRGIRFRGPLKMSHKNHKMNQLHVQYMNNHDRLVPQPLKTMHVYHMANYD